MKIICIGRNYIAHIKELGNAKSDNPIVFLKPDSAILPKKNPFIIPSFSNEVHYETEILVKIIKVGKYIDQKFAHKYYDKIGLGIDFTARDLQKKQKENGLPWEISKGFDGSAVIGEFIDKEAFDLSSIPFQLLKNNQEVQNGNSKNMIWTIDQIIAYVSQFFTLKKGDVIFTGTPSGVGKVEKGDTLEGILNGQSSFNINVR